MSKRTYAGITFHAVKFAESEGGPNPYALGTAKRTIFSWMLSKTDGFTKTEYDEFMKESLENGNIVTRMKTHEICTQAWFSELKNKAEAFTVVEA